jgi:hypothetical protein
VFVATQAVDGRKGADSLMAMVRDLLRQDPLLCVAVRYVAASIAGGRDDGFYRGLGG